MTFPLQSSVDVDRARAIWDDFCRQNDISALKGQTAGIEPVTGRIWFGDSAIEVHDKMVADGVDVPFYAVRVGFDFYLRKGGRR
jgi:hypothetical protein